uniref:Uncharacterized protein n=1 Tax=Megaselia scalaris TaxID=36166 RepID=T1H5S4_MEGSC
SAVIWEENVVQIFATLGHVSRPTNS